ncbi:MAG: metal ABC transporter ATP-binding protein [Candidatus Yanofskybacteria bacterium]|nr:metal ABC transporter ATP-binding protein [Candidatus Yanofskybacteria bacterium]
MDSDKILEVGNLSVSFGDFNVFHDISFEVKKGEAVAIVGPNGSGKSVLFRAILDFIPYSGNVKWAKNIKIGYVPQKLFVDAHFPISVGDFFGFKTKSKQTINEALNSVGITGDEEHLHRHVLSKKLGALSGGQFQRVMIAWAIINKPDILLFDEPTSGIDVGGEETIYNLLHKLQTQNKLALVLISHDLNIVYHYADKVMCLNKEMICFGEPHTVLDPASLSKLYGGEAKFYSHEH